jgi:hypothetical protein
MSDSAFTRALRKMSMPELRVLWAAELDGRLDATLPPRERFVSWYRRQRREAFLAWMATLDVRQCAAVHGRLAAGEDPDAIRADYPNTQPASDDAGHSPVGQHAATST